MSSRGSTVDDQQAEALLKRYRPAGPPEALRERCLTPLQVARVWPWAAAAAALLATTLGVQMAAGAAMAGAKITSAPDPSADAVADLAEALGGDAAARRAAEEIIDLQMRRDQEQAARSTPPMGEFQ